MVLRLYVNLYVGGAEPGQLVLGAYRNVMTGTSMGTDGAD